jgi:hypothetical protein
VTALLLAHAAATLALAGLIWFVQVVHYPLFAAVPSQGFAAYEHANVRRTSLVVVPLMLVEALAAAALAVVEPEVLTVIGLVLVAVIWTSTLLLQGPQHARLSHGLDAGAHGRLVRTNWIRTLAWSGRGVIALALLA